MPPGSGTDKEPVSATLFRGSRRVQERSRFGVRAQFSDSIPGLNSTGDDDPRVDPAQMQQASLGRVHELHRIHAEPLHEFGAAGVRLCGHFDDR